MLPECYFNTPIGRSLRTHLDPLNAAGGGLATGNARIGTLTISGSMLSWRSLEQRVAAATKEYKRKKDEEPE